jgi:8-oxo-dGTP diphosphatase
MDQANTLANLEILATIFSLRGERLQVLLVSAMPDPARALFCLPGAAVPLDQALEEAASQKVKALSGLHETYLEQLYTYGDPRRLPGERRIAVAYFALLPAQSGHAQHTQDAERVEWFPVDTLPTLAADHAEILAYALRRLRYKLEYSAVGFQLLPEYFTLSELQQTYEIVLGEQLDKRNFRRRILEAGIIEQTPHLRGGEGRPARLYRYRPDAVAEVKARRLFP